MRRSGIGWQTGALAPMAALGVVFAQAPGLAQVAPQAGKPMVVLEYAAPASATWGPSVGAPPTSAFGKPATVLLVVPGGYVVRQEVPLEDAIAHASYVSGQIGQPIAITIPDPAGGPPRIEYVGTSRSDHGR